MRTETKCEKDLREATEYAQNATLRLCRSRIKISTELFLLIESEITEAYLKGKSK
jgi:hypothetical protein